MIVNIRGTNGSGKSTIIRLLLEADHRPIHGKAGPRLPEAYEITGLAKRPIYVIGPYNIPSGGCDSLQPFDEMVPPLIERYAARGHVIFEGVLISTYYGGIGAMLERWGKDAIVLFLDTPVETCIERVEARRKQQRYDAKPLNSKLLRAKHATIERLRVKLLREDKLQVISASDKEALGLIKSLLRSAA